MQRSTASETTPVREQLITANDKYAFEIEQNGGKTRALSLLCEQQFFLAMRKN